MYIRFPYKLYLTTKIYIQIKSILSLDHITSKTKMRKLNLNQYNKQTLNQTNNLVSSINSLSTNYPYTNHRQLPSFSLPLSLIYKHKSNSSIHPFHYQNPTFDTNAITLINTGFDFRWYPIPQQHVFHHKSSIYLIWCLFAKDFQ